MRVLFISHTYPPLVGGMQKQSYELIKGFSGKAEVLKLVHDANTESKLLFFLRLKSRVRRILKESEPISLIHLNDGLMALVGLVIRKITKIPIIVTIHGLDIVHPSRLFQKYAVSLMKKHYQGFIAVSRATANECIKRGFAKDLVYTVQNGVDEKIALIEKDEDFRLKLEKKLGISLLDKKILVSIGRPVMRKGFSWFLGTVFKKSDRNVVYIIIGSMSSYIKPLSFLLRLLPKAFAHSLSLALGLGLDEANIRRLLKDKDIEDRAFYLGRVEFSDIVQILKIASLLIMPNIRVHGDIEGFGLVALEAALSGTPVLCSSIDGITDAVINNKNGFHLSPLNEVEWVRKLKELLLDDEFLHSFGQKAREYTLAHYSWEIMAEKYLDIFKKYDNTHATKEQTVTRFTK